MALFTTPAEAPKEYHIVQQPYVVAQHSVEIARQAEYKTEKHIILKEEPSDKGYNCVQYIKSKKDLPQGLSTFHQKIEHVKTTVPQEGSVGITNEGPVGHLVYVEKLEEDGLIISEGNYKHGYITWRKIPFSLVIGYI